MGVELSEADGERSATLRVANHAASVKIQDLGDVAAPDLVRTLDSEPRHNSDTSLTARIFAYIGVRDQ